MRNRVVAGERSADDAVRRLPFLAALVYAAGLLIVFGGARADAYSTGVGIQGCPSRYSCSDPTLTFGGGVYSVEDAAVLDAFPLTATDMKTDPNHGSTVIATAIAAYGTLRVFAYASRPSGPYCPAPSVCFADYADALARAEFWDEMTLVGAPGTAAGTLVEVQFKNSLSGYVLPSAYSPRYAGNEAVLTTCVGTSLGACNLLKLVSASFAPLTAELQGSISVAVGTTMYIYVVLTAQATARTDFPASATAFTVDYLNTGIVYADPRTPGLSLAAASGHDYSTPVAEPSTLLLLGLGWARLARIRRASGRFR